MAKKKVTGYDALPLDKRKALFFKKCTSREELSKFIQLFFGLYLPDQVVSRYADVSPLDVIWEVYEICVNKNNPENIEELLYVAGRGSGKCVLKGTQITTKNGPKVIENITTSDTVWTGKSWQPVLETFNEGVKDGVTITTKKGKKEGAFSLTGSLKHRIQALDPKTGKIDWILMKDLKPDQWVYKTAERVYDKVVDTKSEDYEKGWIIGCITGDGCLHRSSATNVSLCGADFLQLRYYINLVYKHFGISTSRVKRNSKKSVSIYHKSKKFKDWYHSYVDGNLCYFKKLKTLEHTPNFLAGFIAGMMETDGSKDNITLANKDLTYQISQIMSLFGVRSVISNTRRPPSTTKFEPGHIVEYCQATYKNLPEYMLPLFSKREKFKEYYNASNDQFRYPAILIKAFAKDIKEKHQIGNGYWRIKDSSKKTRSSIKYSKDLWGESAKADETWIFSHKLDSFIELAKTLNESNWEEQLKFVKNGYFEQVNTVTFGQHYFYDLEVAEDHAYTSNGFISHNTLGMAIAELLVMLHSKYDICHVGAVLAQAKRCYEYQTKFMLSPRIRPILEDKNLPQEERVLQKLNMEKSLFLIDGEYASIEVLPATLKALNGPHVPLVVADELDTISGEGLRAIKELAGMLDSKGDKKALKVGISTRKSRYGLMNKMIEEAEQAGRHVRKWTAFEFSTRCTDNRSGITPTISYHIQDKMEVIDETTFKLKDAKKAKEYTQHIMPGEKCLKCPAASICIGDAKKQQSKSSMLKPIGELIQKVRSEGADWALAQLMNLKPSVEGIVFKEFDEKIHVNTWNQMWLKLTGVEFPGECTHDMFVKKCHAMNLNCYAGVDWGWSSPNTVVYLFVDKRDNIFIVRCDGMTYMSQPDWVHHLKNKWHSMYRCQLYFPDIADQGAITEMRKAGLPVASEQDKSINTGIQTIKKFLKVPGSTDTKLHIAKETCGSIIEEFMLYHFKTAADGTITEVYDTASDHWIDALRYIMAMLYGKNILIMGGGGLDLEDNKVTDTSGAYFKTPTAEEYAQQSGTRFNAEVDTSKIGKIGKASDLEDDDDFNGSGGFLWSLS